MGINPKEKSGTKIIITVVLVSILVIGTVFTIKVIQKSKQDQIGDLQKELDDPFFRLSKDEYLDVLAYQHWRWNENYECEESVADLANEILQKKLSIDQLYDFAYYCFKDDGSAAIITFNPDYVSMHWRPYDLSLTNDYGKTWTKLVCAMTFGRESSIGDLYSFEKNKYVMIEAGRNLEFEEDPYLFFSNNFGKGIDIFYFGELIPGYEKEKDIVISAITRTKEGNFVILFENVTDIGDAYFYFCGEYDKNMKLINELKP